MDSGPVEDTDIPAWVNEAAPPPRSHGGGWGDDPSPSGITDDDSGHDWDDMHGDAVAWSGRSAHWGRRVLAAVGVLLLLLIAIAVGSVVWVNRHLTGGGGAPVTVTVPADAGHATLATVLTRAGAVQDAWLFRHYLDYRGTESPSPGPYTFHRHEGYRAALRDLSSGPAIVQVRLTIPEGYDLAQIAAAVGKLPGMSAQRFMAAAASGQIRSRYQPANVTGLEGFVFPDTYFVDNGETEAQLLQLMVNRFDQIADSVNLATPSNGLTPYQTLIAASLIEREAKVAPDRGKIARVILNRLGAHMKLQIDATVEYALGVHKTRLLDSDLQVNSPYNTYKIDGLPPGPIASPGKASLAAALNPTPGTWLYYVLISSDGSHGFATTPAEFNNLLALAHARGLR
ncbi:MAG TPA: endolytic transglycosylase MltG [Acidimicrobiales bacterium]|nr:endolytic transglycosylase MltG [Acidimicrobiales bacterium]